MALIGIDFPFRKANGQFPVMATDKDVVRANIIALANLDLGVRVMRPTLGFAGRRVVFDPIDALLESRLNRYIRNLFAQEPRATLQTVTITNSKTTIKAVIVYSVNNIQDTVTLALAK
jgi:phage baseplate assembly protein W